MLFQSNQKRIYFRQSTKGGLSNILKHCSAFALILAVLSPIPAAADTNVVLDRILTDIRDTLINVKRDTEGQLPLKEATLSLQTVYGAEAGGKVKLFVVSFGSKVSTEATQTLKMVLSPPSDGDSTPTSAASDQLAAAIVAAYSASRSARNATPPLMLKTLQTNVKFVIKAEAGGSTGLELLPITAELSGEVSQGNIQEISLTFCERPCK